MTGADRGELHVFADAPSLAEGAARAFAGAADAAVRARGRFTVALSGGRTPVETYRALVWSGRDSIDWSRVYFFWGDERAVPPDDARSNYASAHAALLQPLRIDPAHIHRIEAERDDLPQAAADYEIVVASALGVRGDGPPPAFDLVLLGLGEDGHTASLFPHAPALSIADRWTVATVAPDGMRRISMTFPLINSARAVVFLVAGSSKAPVLERALRGPLDINRTPAQGIQLREGRPAWFVDREAASRL